jgi:CHAT domain-containing protein
LQEASIDLRADADPELHDRRANLYRRLAENRNQRDKLLESGSTPRNEIALQTTLASLAAVENDLNVIEIELRRSNPRFATLSAPVSLKSAEIQALLGDGVLLQYSLGEPRSYAWVVTAATIVGIELAGRDAVEHAARNALQALRTYDPARTSAPPALRELAALVLDPVAAHLHGSTIVLALDGALQYVPFGVLPLGAARDSERLLDNHDIVAVPSISALAVPARSRERPTKTLALFADPVVEQSDPRLTSRGPVTPALASVGFVNRTSAPTLGRLPDTGREAESIAALVPEGGRLVARGFDASRDAVLGAHLDEYRYIHFATHGFVDTRYPALSALALSQFDDRGAPLNGYLRLHDIYDLDLRADLVVLSACETALGRDVRGEGLVGLTQGFLYAGARSLVASLWQVPDRASAELMTRFYAYMLDDGMRPAEALRRWSNPYFWGGFVFLGDWR